MIVSVTFKESKHLKLLKLIRLNLLLYCFGYELLFNLVFLCTNLSLFLDSIHFPFADDQIYWIISDFFLKKMNPGNSC